MRSVRTQLVALAGAVGISATVGLAGGDEPAAAATPTVREAVVRGDAWVDYSLGREAVRRFTIDVRGNPYEIVNGDMVVGAARGTVTFDHHMLEGPDAGKHFYGTIDADYVMTGGPVAVISGTSRDGVAGAPAGSRVAVSVYDSPQGDRFDRIGFSWGAVDPRCVPIGLAPAPFAPVIRHDGYRGGFRVKHAELPSTDGFTGEQPPPPVCPVG
jgi:hypothetical protein